MQRPCMSKMGLLCSADSPMELYLSCAGDPYIHLKQPEFSKYQVTPQILVFDCRLLGQFLKLLCLPCISCWQRMLNWLHSLPLCSYYACLRHQEQTRTAMVVGGRYYMHSLRRRRNCKVPHSDSVTGKWLHR